MSLWMLIATLMQVEVPLTGPTDLERLLRMGMDIPYVNPKSGFAHLIVEDTQLDKLTQAGFTYTVLDYDLAATFRRFFKIGFGPYYTFAEVEARLQDLVNTYGPAGLIDDTIIGYSIEGRPIYAFKVSDNAAVDENEPVVFLNGVTHAREPIGAYITLEFGAWLLDHYATDPEIQWLVDNREIWIVPVVNPDGFVYNESSDGYWRKNKRDNDGDGTFSESVDGVDINRNYGFMWGYDDVGSSPDPSSNTYRGTGPFSEPETQAIRDFVNGIQPSIALNYHSYSNLLLFPYGYANGVYAPDDALFRAMAVEMTRANGYTYGTPWEILYTANGAADDWMYGDTTHPRVLAFTPEVGEAFWQPDTSTIVEQFNENLPMNLFVTRAVGPYLQVDTVLVPSQPFQPGDTVTLQMRVKNLYVGGAATATVQMDSAACAAFPTPASLSIGPFPDTGWVSVPMVVGDTTGSARYTLNGTFVQGTFLQPFTTTVYLGTPSQSTLLQEGFEGGLTWMTGGTGGNWAAASPGATGSLSLQDSPGGNYGNNWDTYVQTTVDLTGYDQARLIFTHRYEIENGYDFAYVQVSSDGNIWTTLATYTDTLGTWQSDTLDISSVVGGVAFLRFRLVTDYSVTYDGWYVDDVRVEAASYGDPACPTTSVAERSSLPSLRLTAGRGYLALEAPRPTSLWVKVHDALGRQVLSRRVMAPVRLPFHAPPGVYFYEVQSTGERVRGQLVIP